MEPVKSASMLNEYSRYIVLTISTSVLGPAVQLHGNASFINKPALGNFSLVPGLCIS